MAGLTADLDDRPASPGRVHVAPHWDGAAGVDGLDEHDVAGVDA